MKKTGVRRAAILGRRQLTKERERQGDRGPQTYCFPAPFQIIMTPMTSWLIPSNEDFRTPATPEQLSQNYYLLGFPSLLPLPVAAADETRWDDKLLPQIHSYFLKWRGGGDSSFILNPLLCLLWIWLDSYRTNFDLLRCSDPTAPLHSVAEFGSRSLWICFYVV